jgi:PAS domain S-box-containing protein
MYVEEGLELAAGSGGDLGPESRRRLEAFLKLLLLDMQIVTETYHSMAMQTVERQRESLERAVAERTAELRQSETRLRDLIETSPDVILGISPDLRIASMNGTATTLLGYEPSEIVGRPIRDLLPAGEEARFRRHVQEVGEKGAAEMESVIRARDGRDIDVSVSSTHDADHEGRFLGIRAFVRDISRRQELTREVQKWERLAAVGTLAAKVAHELRNPLSAISIHVELLDEELARQGCSADGEAREAFDVILKEVDRLSRLVGEYLQFGRLPGGERRKVEPGDILNEVIGLLGQELRLSRVTVTTRIPRDLPPVRGDASQLRQAFINLLRNSREAMTSGGPVRIEARSSGGWVEIVFVDDGPGIPTADVERIFDPFYTTKDSGTGLGLALVRQVVTEHGGTVECLERPTAGAAFLIRIPVAGSEVETERTP